jgi:histidinol phosphatase-like PHP family hydrolase
LHRVDLHVHTPKSTCYRDASVTPRQIVAAALSAGLDAIAITDHHSVAGAIEVRDAARESGLTVFPGIEITAREGHFLGIFDTDAPAANLEDFLRWLGISPDTLGDGHLAVAGDIGSVLKEIEGRGGVAIAAHIERWPSGFLESKEPREVKAAIHASDHLSALEITIPQDKGLWNDGLVRGYSKKYACVQASDSHSLAEIGRRYVMIDTPQIDLAAFREACRDHERRILFPGAEAR